MHGTEAGGFGGAAGQDRGALAVEWKRMHRILQSDSWRQVAPLDLDTHEY